jgi:HD-GYP domain-containing protein (c-di-GMP phosphodiesterase class II)
LKANGLFVQSPRPDTVLGSLCFHHWKEVDMNTRKTAWPDSLTPIEKYGASARPSSKALHLLIQVIYAKDPLLVEHGHRTARHATALGHSVGLSTRDLLDLYLAAVLHDAGKVMLPDTILKKNGSLSQEEYAFMQCHPRDGARLLETIPVLRRAAVLVAHHHEHWDGSGYPYGLRNTFIPLGSRILAIADRFDALWEQTGFDVDERLAMRLIRMLAGSQLDPTLVGVFVQLLEAKQSRMCFA